MDDSQNENQKTFATSVKEISTQLTTEEFAEASTGGIPVVEFQEDLLALVNEERRSNRLPPLKNNKGLCEMAMYQCFYMGSNLNKGARSTHSGPKGEGLEGRMKAFGFKWKVVFENVSRNHKNPRHFMGSIMKELRTRRHVLNSSITEHGSYVVLGCNGDMYWSQIFRMPQTDRSNRHQRTTSVELEKCTQHENGANTDVFLSKTQGDSGSKTISNRLSNADSSTYSTAGDSGLGTKSKITRGTTSLHGITGVSLRPDGKKTKAARSHSTSEH